MRELDSRHSKVPRRFAVKLRLTWASLGIVLISCAAHREARSTDERVSQLDDLSALWSFYKFAYIKDGRVVSLDENGVTTSEGQSYAMLRAVWSDDRATFVRVWTWTKEHLQRREDKLFSWRWKERVLDPNSAADADTDVALALILASRRFSRAGYLDEALAVLEDIWRKEILQVQNRYVVTAGNWAPHEKYPTIHTAYLAPYAYEVFAGVDPRHPWATLIRSSYEILHWLYFEQKVNLPPDVLYVDKRTGELLLKRPPSAVPSDFGYDGVPIFWRVAVDARWFARPESALRRRMLQFFETEWRSKRKVLDRYSIAGKPLSELEGLPHLATVHSLALLENPELAESIRLEKLERLWERALEGESTPYYLHNWLWFGRAFDLQVVRHFDEFLGFLRPFDFAGFSARFPWVLFGLTLLLFPFGRFHWALKAAFLGCGFALSLRYLGWRLFHTLNFIEPLGPVISIGLWIAELYSFSTVALLLVQIGIRRRERKTPEPSTTPALSVDIFVPIYFESLNILDKTLTAAQAIRFAQKQVYVLDDSHRDSVRQMTEEHGATYIAGPRKQAKAGNLNHALSKTSGDLIVVFDTDHIPSESFLEQTVPYFADPGVGFVQTPHHFYNDDIFQRAFRASRAVPNEQDMFNHAIQGGRDSWGGAFFVGSAAVFRRRALDQVGGFNLLSITEDIHTSQKLHAAGWRSVFVDRDLAVGLTAENLSSYIVQRRRWMLGCLQIFFRDNPLLNKGLGLRHRLGYFASLFYFFFPVARVIFWITPLCFLLFHLHPLFTDVSVLLAYLIPYMVALPMLASRLLPGWPRMLWGVLYEMVVAFPLFHALFDLVLPKRLAFKVTPKGILSEKRRLDFSSSKLTWVATVLTLFAIGKGFFEFTYFGIEKDAYFINLGWAIYNLAFLIAALLIAWERPQRRREERVRHKLPIRILSKDFVGGLETEEISLSGLSFFTRTHYPLARALELQLMGLGEIRLRAELVYNERVARHRFRCGVKFENLSPDDRRALTRSLFANAEGWISAHADRSRSNLGMLVRFFVGIGRCFQPLRPRRRLRPRRHTFKLLRLMQPTAANSVLLENVSMQGLRVVSFGKRFRVAQPVPILGIYDQPRWARVVYEKRVLPGVYRTGMQLLAQEEISARPQAYLAA